ncbi:MAG: hypothetical protein M1814_005153 [Vezdaea aestivalis]|nr:MAG: hypothetical protein M1814_005153 [Vezdaea aestivalis]
MEARLISSLFGQLGRHQFCRPLITPQLRTPFKRQGALRSLQFSSDGRSEEVWQQRTDYFPPEKLEEYKKYPMLSAQQLRSRRDRPKRAKMLFRDFMEDSLYNPHYGYFSKQATIFTPGAPFDFANLASEDDFSFKLAQQYETVEDEMDERDYNPTRQLWHTPTTVFRPHYGEAIARYLVTNYHLTLYPYHDLTIYEMGAGNGVMMQNILDYIYSYHPEVYERTRYKIIEISGSLAGLQKEAAAKHLDKVEVINKSIFSWDQFTPAPCFFLALEVFDNFPHDAIRRDPETKKPMQGQVLVDAVGDFYEFYTPYIDPLAAEYLKIRESLDPATWGFKAERSTWLGKRLQNILWPFTPNLTEIEYIPTKLFQFINILSEYFPAHKLVAADFHHLPGTCRGLNGPAVQTRYERQTVPVTTPLVMQGYFDIFFPINFKHIAELYSILTGKFTRSMSHEEFMSRWANVEMTRVRNGENPLLEHYRNASVLTTV